MNCDVSSPTELERQAAAVLRGLRPGPPAPGVEYVETLPGASVEDIRATFAAVGQPLSADVLRLYQAFGGYADWAMDDSGFSFWSLNRIRAEDANRNQRCRDEHVLWFADLLILSHVFGFQYLTAERSAVCTNRDFGSQSLVQDPEIVAGSVEELLHRIVADPACLGWPDLKVWTVSGASS